MPFDSLTFLVLFLPVSLTVVYLFPPRARNWAILGFSLLFFLLGDFVYALCMVASSILDWLAGRWLLRAQPKNARRILFAALAKNGALLLMLKQYANFPAVYYSAYPALGLLIPLGLWVYFFKSASYLFDLYRREAPPQQTPFGLMLYLFFYPALPFGPAIRYADFLPYMDADARTPDVSEFLEDLWCTARGLFKVAVLSSYLLVLWQTVIRGMDLNAGSLTAVCALFCAVLGVYFLWEGFRNLADGLSGMLGFRFRQPDTSPDSLTGPQYFICRADKHLYYWMETYVYSNEAAKRSPVLQGIVHLILLLSLRSFFICDPAMLGIWAIGILVILLTSRFLTGTGLLKSKKLLRSVYDWMIILFSLTLFLLPNFSSFSSFYSMLIRFGEYTTTDALLEGMLRPMLTLGIPGLLLIFSSLLRKIALKTLFRPIGGKRWLLLPASLLLLAAVFVFI